MGTESKKPLSFDLPRDRPRHFHGEMRRFAENSKSAGYKGFTGDKCAPSPGNTASRKTLHAVNSGQDYSTDYHPLEEQVDSIRPSGRNSMRLLTARILPTPHDGAVGRNAALLRVVLIYMFALATLFGMAAIFLMPSNAVRGLLVIGSVALICLTAYALMRGGYVASAGVSFLVGMGIVTTLLSITAGGSQSAAFSGYMCIVLMSGLLFGLRGSVVSAVLCLAAVAGVTYAEVHALLPPSDVQHTVASRLASHAIFLGWIAMLVFQYTRMMETATHDLGERVKELTALHATTQVLQRGAATRIDTLQRVVNLIPAAYQFPDHAAARLRLGKIQVDSPGFEESPISHKSDFKTFDGEHGSIEVVYRRGFPGSRANAFLKEEQDLLDTLVEMIRAEYERRSAYSALNESEMRLRELYDTVRDTVYQLSPDGILISLNPAFESITGWKREDWIGKSFTSLLHPDDLFVVMENFKSTLSGGETPMYEARVITATGEHVVAEFLGVPRFAKGKIIGVLGIARDITRRRRLEEQVQRKQRLESIGMLAGGIAHDLNNVLTPIVLASEILGKRLEDEKAKRMASSIMTAAKRGSEIVKQVLTFASGGGTTSQPQQVRHVLHEMESYVRETFPRSIETRFEIPSSLPLILGDSTQIHQVFMNLCVNARDAMPDGGHLTVSATTEWIEANPLEGAQASGEYVVVTVADSGSGIPAGIRDRIFDPFFTTKKIGMGTGLGLSTCLSIVRSHGGFIHLRSEPAFGTEFRVCFPAATEAVVVETRAEQTVPRGTGETVLLVDDEQASIFFVRDILETYGYSVLVARDGIEGLALFDRMAPESVKLVISDVDRMRMNGVEFSRMLRERNSTVKLLLTSGSVSVFAHADWAQAGTFLSKPYTADELLENVGKLLHT